MFHVEVELFKRLHPPAYKGCIAIKIFECMHVLMNFSV